MRYLIDTNIWIYLLANKGEVTHALRNASNSEWCGYSAISRLELLGFPKLTSDEEARIRTILSEFHEVNVLPSSIDKAIELRKERRIKIPDAIIAATAIVSNATLITANESDFSKIAGLSILNPIK